MSSAKFCHCSTGLLKNVYLVLINSLRCSKSFYDRNFPIFDRQFQKFAKQKLLFVKEFNKVFSALLIQQVSTYVSMTSLLTHIVANSTRPSFEEYDFRGTLFVIDIF